MADNKQAAESAAMKVDESDKDRRFRENLQLYEAAVADIALKKREVARLMSEIAEREVEAKAYLTLSGIRKWKLEITMLAPDLYSYNKEWIHSVWDEMVAAAGDEEKLLRKFSKPEACHSDITEIDLAAVRSEQPNTDHANKFIEFAKTLRLSGTYVWKVLWDGRDKDYFAIFATEDEAKRCVARLRNLAKTDVNRLVRAPIIKDPVRALIDDFSSGVRQQMLAGESEATIIALALKTQDRQLN